MAALLVATSGFLLAVLWMDLMFDVQARRLAVANAQQGDAALASIAAYYRRVTTDAFPMNRLIGGVMLLQVAGIADEVLVHPVVHGFRALIVAALGIAPIGLALGRIFPDAVRLGARRDAVATESALAIRIFRSHVACFVAIAAFLVIQLRLAR